MYFIMKSPNQKNKCRYFEMLCLIVFTFVYQAFCSLFKVRRHVSGCIPIMASNRPLLRVTYEVILLHPSRIWKKIVWSHMGIEPGSYPT